MFCPNCGKAIEEKSKFCPYCGMPTLDKVDNNQTLQTDKEMSMEENNHSEKNDKNSPKENRMPVFIAASIILVVRVVVIFGKDFISNGNKYTLSRGDYNLEFRLPVSDKQLAKNGYSLVSSQVHPAGATVTCTWRSAEDTLELLSFTFPSGGKDMAEPHDCNPATTELGCYEKGSGLPVYGMYHVNSDSGEAEIYVCVVDMNTDAWYMIDITGNSGFITREFAQKVVDSIKVRKK